jgi:hypothetical protein
MPDIIELAKTGRSNCRGCGRGIARGELRFGEALPNPYADGESLFWYHLVCAACMRPDKFGPAVEASDRSVPDAEWLVRTVSAGLEHPRVVRLSRVERAASGSAHCRHCRNPIRKGSWRIALQLFEEGRMQPIGTIHTGCAGAYFGTTDLLERIARLSEGLSPSELGEIERSIREQSTGMAIGA